MTIDIKLIGARIKQRRTEMNLKQIDLAEMLDVSNNHLSSIESGSSTPSLELFVKICDNLNVTPDYLLLGAIHPNNLPQNICDKLNRCGKEEQLIINDIVEGMISRKTQRKNNQ